MCCVSLHLLIGALFILGVKNEDKNLTASTENSITSDFTLGNITTNKTDTVDNFTSTSSPPDTVNQSRTTDANFTSNEDLTDLTTPPPGTQNTETNTNTTENPEKAVPQPTTTCLTTTKPTTKTVQTTKATAISNNHETTYIVIIFIIILCLTGIAVYCCCQKKNRRYSVDFHPKREDAQIPLSTVDAEVFDATSEKDFQTFTPVESTEPVKDPDPAKEAEKPEQGKETADVQQENQQNTSSTEATEIPKNKTEELTIVDLTDGEQAISTKTSMESLDDVLNENNSNNTRAEVNDIVNEFTEISLNGLL